MYPHEDLLLCVSSLVKELVDGGLTNYSIICQSFPRLLTMVCNYQRATLLKFPTAFEKRNQPTHFRLCKCYFMWGAYFCTSAYNHNRRPQKSVGIQFDNNNRIYPVLQYLL